ncbi:STAS-like domain-containing protein [Chryseobacterium aahli]|uniref:STAS-like domain-containing protein n=1 Tax=Chryseobacterium aahli TaxID=1278643 RepID=UPI001F6068A3|nr:STAS-like domain-containing protein [Chryseobacterium aahli]MCI3937067.1 STAS-like domain-containing protein [Chryseobacterium aahli]
MDKIIVKVKDFTEYPDARYIEHDSFSGEEFYYEYIKPNFEKAVSENKYLVVDLDDTAGYASSFLDEAFGNLVYDFSIDIIKLKLKIISNQEPDWIDLILEDIIDIWKEKKEKGLPRKEL